MKLAVYFLTVLIIACSCGSTKVDSLTDTELPYLTFTSGGGFAGKYTTYILLENGQVFNKASEMSEEVLVGKVKKNTAAQIFSNYQVLDFDNVDQVSYGNYTYSIMKQEGTSSHKLIWEKDQAGAEIYQTFFKNAMNAIQKRDAIKPKMQAKKQ